MSSHKNRVAAIVSALNEEKTIGNILKTLLQSREIDEVILVDDGSTDRTAEIGKKVGAMVISSNKIGRSGKGEAMERGVKSTEAEVIVFFDADLIGLKEEHISQLVKPILDKEAFMVVGIRDRYSGLPGLIIKIDPLLAIGGERAMNRSLFESVPKNFRQGFAVETALNFYCLKHRLKVIYPKLKGLTVVVKEKKWGFYKGFKNRLKMIWQMIKIRFLISKNKNKF